jgi:hypothetical protein
LAFQADRLRRARNVAAMLAQFPLQELGLENAPGFAQIVDLP